MTVEARLPLLVCPLTRGPLIWEAGPKLLVSPLAGLAYPVRDGVPVLLIEEAVTKQEAAMGPVEQEMIARLTAGLQPARLVVRNDSERHLGHAGHDGSGESHFTIEVVSDLSLIHI